MNLAVLRHSILRYTEDKALVNDVVRALWERSSNDQFIIA